MLGIMPVLNPAHILIVEPESTMRDTMRCWLERVGYRCQCADHPELGRARLETHTYDVVTIELSGTGEKGLEFLGWIKSNCPDTEVLMLSAQGDAKLGIHALHLGAYGNLPKPLEREELLCQVERALEHSRMVIEARDHMSQLELRVREQTRHIRQAHEETIQRLVMACMFRDDETSGHIKRTGLASALVAEAAGWSTEMAELIRLAAPMHDVGKVGIPDAILRNPGRLTPKEHAIMQTHTVLGARMLSGSLSPVLQMAEQIAHYHHERWDGSGYPERLSGGNIPKAARIMAIVDVYDALTHDRPYRAAFPEADVLRKIEASSGTHFDPVIVGSFFDALPGIRKINSCELDTDFSPHMEMFPQMDDVPMTMTPASV